MKIEATPCVLDDCMDPSHVVLYANQGGFRSRWPMSTASQTYDGQPLGFCLRHGGQILILHRVRESRPGYPKNQPLPPWVLEAGWDLTQLPTVWAKHHIRPQHRPAPWRNAQRTPRQGAERPAVRRTPDRRMP